jgi:hypothetical protein
VLDRARALQRDRVDGAGEIKEVRALGLVELKRAGERFQDQLGDAADVAALQALVVLDANAGQRGDLLAAQPGHAPRAVARQAGLLGRDLRPPGRQELGDVAVVLQRLVSSVGVGGRGQP